MMMDRPFNESLSFKKASKILSCLNVFTEPEAIGVMNSAAIPPRCRFLTCFANSFADPTDYEALHCVRESDKMHFCSSLTFMKFSILSHSDSIRWNTWQWQQRLSH